MPEFHSDLIDLRWSLGLRFLEILQEIKYISRVSKATRGKELNDIFPGPRTVIANSGISKVQVRGSQITVLHTSRSRKNSG